MLCKMWVSWLFLSVHVVLFLRDLPACGRAVFVKGTRLNTVVFTSLSWGNLSKDQSWAVSETILRLLCLVTLYAWLLFSAERTSSLLEGLTLFFSCGHLSTYSLRIRISFFHLSYFTLTAGLPKGCNGIGVAFQGPEGMTRRSSSSPPANIFYPRFCFYSCLSLSTQHTTAVLSGVIYSQILAQMQNGIHPL